ncbi:Pre-mRNA-splicing factor 18 [Yarrowia sp. B02]|nr:Pre-mRNA-splicing factor 18 [Yarrowia sp. B02]
MDFAALIQGEISKKKAGAGLGDYGCKAAAPKQAPKASNDSSDDIKRLERLKQMKRQRELDREEERLEREESKRAKQATKTPEATKAIQEETEAPEITETVEEMAARDARTNVCIDWRDVATKKDATRDTDTKHKLAVQLRVFLARLLSEWEGTLDKGAQVSGENELDTSEAANAVKRNAIFAETQSSLSSLMVLLRHNGLQDEVLAMLSKVMYHVQHEEHHQAYDVYLKLCIGNACWPVGVASIGIHARASQNKTIASARNSKQVAHIVNDDTRQWLVCIKRLLTFAEGYESAVRRALLTVVDQEGVKEIKGVQEEATTKEDTGSTKEETESATTGSAEVTEAKTAEVESAEVESTEPATAE